MIEWCRDLIQICVYGRKIEFYEGTMPCGENPQTKELEVLCPDCRTWVNRRDFLSDWDWSGPSCRNCGSGGLSYFSRTNHVTSGKSGM